MSGERPPTEILAAARERARARREHDFAEADRLKALIEAAGWRVVDRRRDFELRPAVPPDVIVDGVVRHGSSRSVPSRLGDAASEVATFVVAWGGSTDDVLRAARDLRATQPAGTSVVAVLAPGSDGEAADAAGAPLSSAPSDDVEIVRMAGAPTPGAAANAGIRRTAGRVIVLLAGSVRPIGDVATPLVQALDDPTVAIAGFRGGATNDLRHFVPVEDGDADVIGAGCVAFRREDYLGRGPLDERFLGADGLAAGWSLALRDESEGRTPRRAVVVADLPLEPPGATGEGAGVGDAVASDRQARAARRDFYRLQDRYGRRPDLIGGRVP